MLITKTDTVIYPTKLSEFPTNKEYYLELNKKLRAVGLPEFIVTDDAVYKDMFHAKLGIGIRLDS